MRVKCVNNDDLLYYFLTVGKEYELIKETEDRYYVETDNREVNCFFKRRFEIVKEDKMEEIKIIRKLEDLEGLENGMGLRLNWNEDEKRIKVKKTNNTISCITTNDIRNLGAEYAFDILKAMGFKFQYKPLRTVEEVITEMKENSLNIYQKHNFEIFEVEYGKVCGEERYCYEVCNTYGCYTLGGYIFNEETAQKYADELNEIIGGK